MSKKVHPQDIIVEEILHKICSEKYGENWISSAKSNDSESAFDSNRKQYFSPRPKHGIQFQQYKQEMSGCI